MLFRGSRGETRSASIEGPPWRPLSPAKARRKIDEAPAGSSSDNQTLPGDGFVPDRSLAAPPPRRLLREQIGQVIGARTANFINLPGQHQRAYLQRLDLRCVWMLLFK